MLDPTDSEMANLDLVADRLRHCERGRDVLLIPSLNQELLGDKLLLSGVFEWIKTICPALEVWAMDDGSCTFPMQSFAFPPDRIVKDRIERLPYVVTQEPRIGLVFALSDHNSVWVPRNIECSAPVIHCGLWTVLAGLKVRGFMPRVRVPAHVRSRVRELLDFCLPRSDARYFAVHLRSLARDSGKNVPFDEMQRVISLLVSATSLPCLIFGNGDRRSRISGPMITDLMFEEPLRWTDTISLLANAWFFLGSDSGPLHLAAACGAKVICLNHANAKFGPFCPEEQLAGRIMSRQICDLESARGLISELVRYGEPANLRLAKRSTDAERSGRSHIRAEASHG